jgi:serine/threonine protein kinase
MSQEGASENRNELDPVEGDQSAARLDSQTPLPSELSNSATLLIRGMQVVAPSPVARQLIVPPGFEVLDELGRGGMAVVYRARELGLNRIVALKVLKAGSYASEEELRRFRIEAETVARLDHPNIVRIHAIREHQGIPYLALELVDGGNLDRLIHGQPQEPRIAAHLIIQLCRAIHAAHEVGIIHRDLKPSNILLTKNNLPKIADFGAAKRHREGGFSETTQPGVMMGTPSYVAPEQALGNREQIGPAVDIYSLGVMLYELLTGAPPFSGGTPLETINKVVHDEPPLLTLRVPTCPLELQSICLKCLEKDPSQRYASAMDLAIDLERWAAGDPIRSQTTRRFRALGRRIAKLRASYGLTLIATAVALGCTILMVLNRLDYQNQLQQQHSQLMLVLPADTMLKQLEQIRERPFVERESPREWLQSVESQWELIRDKEEVLSPTQLTEFTNHIDSARRWVQFLEHVAPLRLELLISLYQPGFTNDPDAKKVRAELWQALQSMEILGLPAARESCESTLDQLPFTIRVNVLRLIDDLMLTEVQPGLRIELMEVANHFDGDELRRRIRRTIGKPEQIVELEKLTKPAVINTLDVPTLLLLHRTLLVQDNARVAGELIERTLGHHANSFDWQVEKGIHYLLKMNMNHLDASEGFQAAQSLRPDRLEITYLLGVAWLQQQRVSHASTLFEILIADPKAPSEAQLGLAVSLEMDGKKNLAETFRKRYQSINHRRSILARLLER